MADARLLGRFTAIGSPEHNPSGEIIGKVPESIFYAGRDK